MIKLLIGITLLLGLNGGHERVTDYVDPTIGSEGEAGCVVGPVVPFGMVRPAPECTPGPNSGWAPLPRPIHGFAQTHLSGTGGSPRYGNVLIMPFTSGADAQEHLTTRQSETIELGYYGTTLEDGTKVELTSSHGAVMYHIAFAQSPVKGIEVDAGYARHGRGSGAQRVIDSDIEVVSPTELEGYTTVEGGWGGGGRYTVYFYIVSDTPASDVRTLERQINALWSPNVSEVRLKVGISFLSTAKARANVESELPDWDMDAARARLIDSWDELLERVQLDHKAPLKYKKMFYTALYHTMLMPSDRKGEWSKLAADEPYYDDFYTLWDTYRTSMPLITLLDPARQVDVINGLLNVYRVDGWMPDGRSGNCNGITQGSSNADIVIADAFVKGLKGIDYEQALQAMLKDATVEAPRPKLHGRVGVKEYDELGYLPWGVSKAGSRTVDHSFCDYAIHVVAEGLGHEDISQKYLERSHNWQNLYRDYEEDGIRGFIMPRDAEGNWLDETLYSRAEDGKSDTLIIFRPNTSFHKHWVNFFYEANAYETSLCMPHDIDRLIEFNGGREGFTHRLDRLFADGCYDGGNEPSFLTTSLYHWVGRPELTAEICNKIVREDYSDQPNGIPGNDDSGAMSSWMAWHMIGLYPVAGFDYYLVHAPVVKSATFALEGGRKFTIKARGLSDSRRYVKSARLNGRKYPYSTLRHEDIVKGGRLVLKMSKKPGKWGEKMFKEDTK